MSDWKKSQDMVCLEKLFWKFLSYLPAIALFLTVNKWFLKAATIFWYKFDGVNLVFVVKWYCIFFFSLWTIRHHLETEKFNNYLALNFYLFATRLQSYLFFKSMHMAKNTSNIFFLYDWGELPRALRLSDNGRFLSHFDSFPRFLSSLGCTSCWNWLVLWEKSKKENYKQIQLVEVLKFSYRSSEIVIYALFAVVQYFVQCGLKQVCIFCLLF